MPPTQQEPTAVVRVPHPATEVIRGLVAVVAGAAILTASIAVTGFVAGAPVPEVEVAIDDVPTLEEAVDADLSLPSRVYAADGSLIGEFRPEHTQIPLDPHEIPETVRIAVLAAEDAEFYDHRGYDVSAIVRAGLRNLMAGETVQGGSTITQQLAKNLVTGDEESLDRKVQELAVAIDLEERYEKDELLTAYLNIAYFGEGAVGIAAAAEAYFAKAVAELTLSEAALLAGLLPAPSEWSPRQDPSAAEARHRYVLDRVEAIGAVDATEVAEARELPELAPRAREAPTHPYFMDYVRRYAQATLGYSERLLYQGGLEIHTTLHPDLQDWAQEMVRAHLHREDDPSGAVAVVEPGTGEVRALVGGHDWDRSEVNLALGSLGAGSGRQPGSAFKTFVMAAALEAGVMPDAVIPAPEEFVPEGADRPMLNYTRTGYGELALTEALVRSVNTSFAWLTEQLGPDTVAETARRLGIAVPDHPGVSLGIGAYETSPLDMAGAYAALASDGRWHAPTPITRIVDRDGTTIAEPVAEVEPVQAVDPLVARALHAVLGDVIARGTGTRADIGRPAAGKTGTSNDHRDAWFAGYTPQLATAVWVGYPGEHRPMLHHPEVGRVTGGSLPAAIWRDVMVVAHHYLPVEELPPPGDLTDRPAHHRLADEIGAEHGWHQPSADHPARAPRVPVDEPTTAPAPQPGARTEGRGPRQAPDRAERGRSGR